jgi:hypothetical protein
LPQSTDEERGVSRRHRPESAMLTPYACFARRVNSNSENAQSIVVAYGAWGCFAIFVSAPLVAAPEMIGFVPL